MKRGLAMGVTLCLAGALSTAMANGGFGEYLTRFRAALLAEDASTIAAMTRLPFLFEGHLHDRAAFRSIVPRLFDGPVRQCFQQARPVAEGADRVIFCKPYAFYFRPDTQGRYWLAEFVGDGEDAP